MSDDVEAMVRTALRDEVAKLPFVLQDEQLEERLTRDSRRSRLRMAASAVAAVLVVVGGVVIANRDSAPLGGARLDPDACPSSTIIEHEGGQREIGGPHAYFDWPFGNTPTTGIGYKLLIRVDDAQPAPSLLLIRVAPFGERELKSLSYEEWLVPVKVDQGLRGTYYFHVLEIEAPGCWRISAGSDATELGVAIIEFSEPPASSGEPAWESR